MNKADLFFRSNLILSLITGVGLLTFFLFQQMVGSAVAQPQPVSSNNSDIITDTVWTAAGSPYLITGTVTIIPGVALTIEAGVSVLGAGSGYPLLAVVEDASLVVQGTADSPVTFSSQVNSGPGDWASLFIGGSAMIDHALFENSYFNLEIEGESGGPVIVANTVFSRSVYGLSVAINALHRLQMTNVAFVDVVNNRILVDIMDFGSLSDNVTLTAHPGLVGYEWGPYAPVLEVPAGITLTLAPGVTLMGTPVGTIWLNGGHLQAVGTPQAPITFTAASGMGEEWAGIAVGEGGTANLEHSVIEKGIYNLLMVPTAGPVTLKQSQSAYGRDVPLVVTAEALHHLHMEEVYFHNNGANRVIIHIFSDSLLSDNAHLTAQPGLEGYELWHAFDVTNDLIIPAGVTLTAEADVTIFAQEETGIRVEGHLQAVGTPGSPITFTAASGIPGDWPGIYVGETGSTYLEEVTIEKGLFNLGIGPSSGPVSLKQSRFSQSALAPLIVDVAALDRLQMEAVDFHDNALNRILLDTDSASPLSDNAYLTAQPGLEGYELWHGGLAPFDLIVPAGVTLTTESGVTLFVPEGDKVQVEGHLQASGTLTHSVTFTGVLTGTAGWGGLYLQGTAVLSHTHVTQSQASGILVDGGDLTAECSTVSHNQTAGIWVLAGGSPQVMVRASNFFGNEQAGLNNENSSQAEARFNWWGDASGPGGDGPGSGDAVWGEVLYEPWLTETAICPLPDEEIEPELLVELTAVPLLAAPGETITYTLILTNSGNVSLHELSSTVQVGSGFSLPESLAPGASFTASYTYTVLADDLPGPLVNTVSVTAVPPGHGPIVIETAVTVVLYQPDFRLYLPLVRATE
jgi:uncharacterized repeat protein (TIGR01451 family)